MSSAASPTPPSSNEGEETGTPPQRKRSRKDDDSSNQHSFELMVLEEEQALPVLEHLANLPFLLDQGSACRLQTSPSHVGERPSNPGKHTIVVGVTELFKTDRLRAEEEEPEFAKQVDTCRALGVCPSHITHSLLRGYFPENMIVYKRSDGTDMLLWYATSKAVDGLSTLVVIDVTDWQIIPGFYMRSCRCVLEEEKNRCARHSLRSLSNLIEDHSDKLSEQEYLQACGHMKQIFKSLSD